MEGTGAIMTSWFGIDALHCSNDHYVACNTQTTFLAFGSQLALVYWTVVNVLTCLSVRYSGIYRTALIAAALRALPGKGHHGEVQVVARVGLN